MATRAAAAAAPPPQSNWLSEWAARTPLVTRCALYIVLPLSITGLFWSQLASALVLDLSAVLGLQLWRFITMLPLQLGIFIFLFVVFHLVVKAPLDELQLGSLRYLARILTLGLLINVLWAAISTPLYLFAFSTALGFLGAPVSSGLFPFLLAQISIAVLADPDGHQMVFGCLKIPNRAYPWAILGLFCLLSFSIRLDLLLGVLVGHAVSRGYLRRLELSDAWVAAAETGSGIAVRTRMTSALGYVYAPSTELPPDLRRQRDEAAAQTGWGALMAGGGARGASGGGSAAAPGGQAAGADRFTVVRGGLSSGSQPLPAAAAAMTGPGRTLGSSAAPTTAPQQRSGGGTGEAIGPVTQRMLQDLEAKRAAAAAAADARSRAAAARLMSVADRQAALSGGASPRAGATAPPAPAPAPRPSGATADPVAAAAADADDGFGEDDEEEGETVNLLTMPGDAPPPPPPARGGSGAPATRGRSSTASATDLVAMGFDREAVDRALALTHGDVDRAIMLLTEI